MIRTGQIAGRFLEEELFGHLSREGGWALAEGGTLLIEEITGLPHTCQAKLLEVAENRHALDSGYRAPASGDFRLMATTRYNLSQSVERGMVREDLFYRLAVVTIRVPPLRERIEDIPLLVRHLLSTICESRGKSIPSVSPRLMQLLANHAWPGNASQLGDVLGTMVLAEEIARLDEEHLPDSFSEGTNQVETLLPEPIETLAELEREAVTRALNIHRGNRTRAAHSLGISVRTLQRKLRQWGM